eukprot:2867856-Ditylum_brightwellii.AAC.1
MSPAHATLANRKSWYQSWENDKQLSALSQRGNCYDLEQNYLVSSSRIRKLNQDLCDNGSAISA